MGVNLILGPMFGGKTKLLIERYKEAVREGCATFCVKPKLDDRFSNTQIVAHDGSRISALPVNGLSEIALDVQEARDSGKSCAIFVDEGQFMSCLALSASFLAEQYQATVHIAALNGDFLRRPWPVVSDLLAIASTVQFMTDQPCRGFTCGGEGKARFTAKLAGADTGKLIDVGGADKYTALCERCYFTHQICKLVPGGSSAASSLQAPLSQTPL